MDAIAKRKAELAEQIWGRMTAENAVDLSDAEIERTLAPCVCGGMLVRVAKELRTEGLLKAPGA